MTDVDPTRVPSCIPPQADTLPQLARLVSEMRQAQKRYFREGSLENLAAARALESRVDKSLIRILNPSLF